jgi:hypothetical protein
MSDAEPLRRVGGGRWQTRDERFSIEPQSGTWMVVDATQTDELGLPLVRGPFGSLGAAREAIAIAREQPPPPSPLTARIDAAPKRSRDTGSTKGSRQRPARRQPPAAEEPPEPAWLAALEPPRRKRAHELIDRLERAGIPAADAIARAEIAKGEPALAGLAIERRIEAAVGADKDPVSIARAIAKVVVAGEDAVLGTKWRLVDGDDRPIARLSIAPQKPRE